MESANVTAMEIANETPLQKPDVASEFFLAVHKDDQLTVERTGIVPRRLCAATNKEYIGLRENAADAVERAVMLMGKNCEIHKGNILLLRIQFSHKGFAQYAFKALGPDEAFAPMLHKILYPNDKSGRDYGAWAFHGDLPLQHKTEDGQVLIACEWLEIMS